MALKKKNKYFPGIFQTLMKKFEKFPGIGKKSAERFVLYLADANPNEIDSIIHDMNRLKIDIKTCKICSNYAYKSDVCAVCSDETRDQTKICVVEDPQDIHYIERTEKYDGLYHVLRGKLNPLKGVNPENLTIKQLLKRLDGINEVIIATNTDTDGNITALYIANLLKSRNITATRLGVGIPIGTSLNNTDLTTMVQAFQFRHKLDD